MFCGGRGLFSREERRGRAGQGSAGQQGKGWHRGVGGVLWLFETRSVEKGGENNNRAGGTVVGGREGGSNNSGGGGDIVVPPTPLSASSVGYRVEGRFQFSLEAIDEQAFKGYDTVGLPYKKVVISLQNPGLRIRIQ